MPKAKRPTSTRPRSVKKAVAAASAVPRRLPLPKRIWFKPWTWRQNLPAPKRGPLPKATALTKSVVLLLGREWKLFGAIILIYGLLSILLVRGISNGNLANYKSGLSGLFSGIGGQTQAALVSFSYLILTSGGGNGTNAGVYQTLLLIIISLALIWALRQTLADKKVRIRDSFYKGISPIIPFFLVLLVIGLQLLPAAIGSYLYSAAVGGGVANDIIEKACFAAVFALFSFWSLRMITASLFALYIVTLPDMTPIKALKSAGKLVYKRRLLIWRKLILLPVLVLAAAAIIELPVIMFWAPAASWLFFLFSLVSIAFVHAYIYKLYREML